MAFRDYWHNVRRAAASIFEGMAVTLSYLVRKPVTVQYPDRTPQRVEDMLPDGYRGLIEADVTICTGCQMCAKSCPIGCIAVQTEKDAATGGRIITRFDVDAALCMHCGLCTENCPTGAIRHTKEFEGATRHVANLIWRFVQPGAPVPTFKAPKDKSAIVTRPLGEALGEARRPFDAPPALAAVDSRGETAYEPFNPPADLVQLPRLGPVPKPAAAKPKAPKPAKTAEAPAPAAAPAPAEAKPEA